MLLNKQINQNKKQGVTLVEVLIVLAIAAVVIAGALVLYGNLQRNSAVNEETTNLSAMFQNIDNFFRRGTTTGLGNDDAIAAGFIPSGMLITDEASVDGIENSFGGRVIIGGEDAAPPAIVNTKGFSVTYTVVPQEACVNMVQGQARVGWTAYGVVTTAGAAFEPTTRYVATDGTRVADIDIITDCNVANTEFVDIVFVKDSESALP